MQKTKKSKSETSRLPSVLSLCCFFSMMTAIVIAIVLALVFAFITRYFEALSSACYSGEFQSAISKSSSEDFVPLSHRAMLDMLYNTKSSGFVFVTNDSCDSNCADYARKLRGLLTADEDLTIYRYNSSKKNSANQDAALAGELILGRGSAPALIYVYEGNIFDRVDNLDNASTESFIEKYS